MASLKTTFASLPRTKRGSGIVLGPDPNGKTFLYTNGNSVFIRDVESASKCDTYTEHAKEVFVAKYSPSRFYIASGDAVGKIRVWDTTQAEHPLKAELQPLSGAIRDIAWTGDSQRMAVGGEGREKFCHVFMWDSGTSVGDLMGHDKAVNSVDFRTSRPFRLATGSEDRSANLFEGPPFKLKTMLKDAKNFVNCVRFSPDGTALAAATQDGHVFLYDATSGDLRGEVGNGGKGPAHSGGIYALSFSPDSKHILTASGDKTAKVFDVASRELVGEFVCGKTTDDMLVGNLWQAPNTIIVVSLAGFMYYLELDSSEKSLKVKRVLRGHNKPITALAVFHCHESKRHFYATGSSDGRIYKFNLWQCLGFFISLYFLIRIWDANNADCWVSTEAGGHANGVQVQSLAVLPNQSNSHVVRIASVATDDTLRYVDFNTETSEVKFSPDVVKLDSQPLSVAALNSASSFVAIACLNHLVVVRGNKKLTVVDAQPFNANFRCVTVLPSGQELAVGLSDKRVRIFVVENADSDSSFRSTERQLDAANMTHTGAITALAYSPDGRYLAAADQQRRVRLYNVASGYNPEIRDEWCHSNASVTSIAWSPDSKFIAAGSVDTSITFYSVEPANSRLSTPGQVRGAHPLAPVTGLAWPLPDSLLSIGQDACLRVWTPASAGSR